MGKAKLVILIAVLMLAMAASASFAYTGSLSSGNGLIGTGSWAEGSTLDWTVVQNQDGSWSYTYTLSVEKKGISHFIVEVSDGFTAEDLFNVVGSTEINTYFEGSQGNSNPGLFDAIYGIKFESGVGTETSWTVSFDTFRAPVWGDFYAKDGVEGQTHEDVFLYNAGLGDPDPTDPASDGSIGNKILRPDTVVPEPSSILLFVSGLSAVGAFCRRRR